MNEKARTPVKTPALPVKAMTVYRKVPVIVEGVDCSGKTTFCKWIVEQLINWKVNVEFSHHGPLRASVRREYYDPLNDLCLYPTVLVGDRWHLGEMVYGPLYRGSSEMDDEELSEIEKLLNKLGAKKILLDPPEEIVKERMLKRGEDFLQQEDLHKARLAYQVLAKKKGYDVIRYPRYEDAARIAKEAADECGRHTLQIR